MLEGEIEFVVESSTIGASAGCLVRVSQGAWCVQGIGGAGPAETMVHLVGNSLGSVCWRRNP